MSSRFAPSKQSQKRPAVCIKPRSNLPPPYPGGIPNALHAFADWIDTAIPIHLAESFPLYYDAGMPGWKGASTVLGWNLAVEITIPGPADTFTFILKLRNSLTIIDDDSWHNVTIDPPPPWNSGLLRHVHVPGQDANHLQVLD